MSTNVDLAFRARLATLTVCTTGSTTLAATSAGYTRSSGSFVDDGFAAGMEVTQTGFGSQGPALIEEVTATLLRIRGGRTAAQAASGRTLRVGLPSLVSYENGPVFEPVQGRSYLELQLVEQPPELLSFPANGGTSEERGLYVVRWYSVAGYGRTGIGRCVDAVKALFTSGTTFAAPDGSTVRVRGDAGPSASQLQNRPAGFALIAVSIPWRRYVANAVQA